MSYLHDGVANVRTITITISKWSRASVKVTSKLASSGTVVDDVEPCGDGDHVSVPAIIYDNREEVYESHRIMEP